MSDGFTSGLAAAQADRQQQQGLLAQIYSTALQTNAQMQMERFKAYHDMQRALAEQAGLERRAGIKARADVETEAYKQKGETGRAILHEEAESQRKWADLMERRTTEILKQRMQDATTQRGQDLSYASSVEGHLISARQQAQASLLTAQGNLTNYALQQEMPIEQAIALGRTAGLPAEEALAVASSMRNPRAERQGMKAAADLQKTAAEIAETWQRTALEFRRAEEALGLKPAKLNLDLLKHGETVRRNTAEELADSQARFMKLQPLYGDWLKKNLTSQNPHLENPMVAKAAQSAFSGLTQLADARAAGRIDNQQFLQRAARFRADLGGVSDEVLQQGIMLKSLLTGNAARFSGAAGVAVALMPEVNLANMHRDQPPEARGMIDRILSALTMHAGERTGAAFSGAAPDGDRLTNAFSAAYGQTHLNAGGKATAPSPQVLAEFDAKSPWEKVQILRGLAGQSEAARDAVGLYDRYSVSVGGTLVGDVARGMGGQETQGDFGLLGDVGAMLVGGLIGRAAGGVAGWMWVVGKGVKYTAPIFNKAEAAVGKAYERLGRPFAKPGPSITSSPGSFAPPSFTGPPPAVSPPSNPLFTPQFPAAESTFNPLLPQASLVSRPFAPPSSANPLFTPQFPGATSTFSPPAPWAVPGFNLPTRLVPQVMEGLGKTFGQQATRALNPPSGPTPLPAPAGDALNETLRRMLGGGGL